MKKLLFFTLVTTSFFFGCADKTSTPMVDLSGGSGGELTGTAGNAGNENAGGEGGSASAGTESEEGGNGGEGNSPIDSVGGHAGNMIGGEGGEIPQEPIGDMGGQGGGNGMQEPVEPLVNTLEGACAASEASQAICEVRQTEAGAMNIRIDNAYVTGVGLPDFARDGFFIQIERSGPGLFVETDTSALQPAIERGQRVSFTVTETTEGVTFVGLDPEDPNNEIRITFANAIANWQVLDQIEDLSFLETSLDAHHPNLNLSLDFFEAFENLLRFSALHKTISINIGKAPGVGELMFGHFIVGIDESLQRIGIDRNCEKHITQTPMWVTDFGAHDMYLMITDPAQLPIENCDLPELSSASRGLLKPSARGEIVNIRFSQLLDVETVTSDTLQIISTDTGDVFPISEIERINENWIAATEFNLQTQELTNGEYEVVANEGIFNAYGDPINLEMNRATFQYIEPDLIISEIFVNPPGTDEGQFIEIYNGKSTPVRLADYAIALYEEEIQNLNGTDTVTLQFHRHLPLAEDDRELSPYSFAVLTPDANVEDTFAWELPENAFRITFGNGSESLFPHPGSAVLINTTLMPDNINLPFLDSRLYITPNLPYFLTLQNFEISPEIFRLVEPTNGYHFRTTIGSAERDTSVALISSSYRIDARSGLENIIHSPELDFEAEPTPGR